METLKVKSKKKWHDLPVTGNWVLIYKTTNTNGPESFGGKHLGVYKSPFDGSKVFRKSVDDRPLTGFMIDKLSIKLTPDESLDHKLLINWLICHPEVRLEGFKKNAIKSEILQAKTGRKITLKCLDYIAIEEIDNDDYIDKLIGKLSLDTGKHAIGLEKLRHIMAALNMSYRDNRFEGESEKKALRSKLKSFARKSLNNAKDVYKVIDDLDGAKDLFLFKEMLKHRVIQDFGGQYKYNNVPLGTTSDNVFVFFNNHPEVKANVLQDLYKIID